MYIQKLKCKISLSCKPNDSNALSQKRAVKREQKVYTPRFITDAMPLDHYAEVIGMFVIGMLVRGSVAGDFSSSSNIIFSSFCVILAQNGST